MDDYNGFDKIEDVGISIKQRIILCLIVAVIVSPISVIIAALAYCTYHIAARGKPYYYLGGAAIVSIATALAFHQIPMVITIMQFILADFFYSLKENVFLTWMLSDGWSCAFSLLLYAIALYVLPEFDSKRRLIKKEEHYIENRRMNMYVSFIDYRMNVNQIVLGVTGSGKTQYLLKMCECYLGSTDDLIIFVDGKASVDEQYGIYQTMKLLANRYAIDLVVLNGTNNHNVEHVLPYNPFAGVDSPDVIRDMVLALMFPDDIETTADSEHYRTMFEAYLTVVLQLMLKYNIKITLLNIVTLLDQNSLTTYIEDPDNSISDQDKEAIRNMITEDYDDVSSSITKLKMFINGEGNHIFACNEQASFNMRSAYNNNQIVVVLIDEMSMPSFASGIARLVNMDIRYLIAGRLNGTIDTNKYCHVIEDEFSSYPNKAMLSILARARSADCNLVLATQSVCDIKAISNDVFGKVTDNVRRFVFFSQNSSDSAQEVADLIGTDITVSSTARSFGGILTHEASNTIEREYRVSPDEIKAMKPNEGVIFDKADNSVKYFKNKFVER